jgi:hypothetical protein
MILKCPSSEPHNATRPQQAIMKTSAEWFAYQILSAIIVFAVLVSEV